jgi:hypothetical protein
MQIDDRFQLFLEGEQFIILQIDDVEISDEFDDFLIENTDYKTYFRFIGDSWQFMFPIDCGIDAIFDIYKKFREFRGRNP